MEFYVKNIFSTVSFIKGHSHWPNVTFNLILTLGRNDNEKAGEKH